MSADVAANVEATLLESDALTGNDEGTPTHYVLHADDVPYLAQSIAAALAETRPHPERRQPCPRCGAAPLAQDDLGAWVCPNHHPFSAEWLDKVAAYPHPAEPEQDDRLTVEALIRRLPSLTEGVNREGTATWSERDRDVYSLAVEECQAALTAALGRRAEPEQDDREALARAARVVHVVRWHDDTGKCYTRTDCKSNDYDEQIARAVLATARRAPQPERAARDHGLRDVLHDVWLRVHVRRFDGPEPPEYGNKTGPDSIYRGIQLAEQAITDVAAEHGIDWHALREPTVLAEDAADTDSEAGQ